jgi:hypothetical protein
LAARKGSQQEMPSQKLKFVGDGRFVFGAIK